MKADQSKAEIQLQREYYSRTAARYDSVHLQTGEGHDLASCVLTSMVAHYDFQSVLDVGAGTGRTLRALSARFPDRKLIGIEPVAEMRLVGQQHGLSAEILRDGDATKLAFPDKSFDVVSAFGMLHHVPHPALVVAEMLRVARRAIFISDANRFAQGTAFVRRVKRWSYQTGLWPALHFLHTRGRGYTYSEGDGVAYSYSVFDDYAQIKTLCPVIHLLNLTGNSPDLIYGAEQIGLLALK